MGNGLMPATWTPISGPYTATYNGVAIGATSEGFRIRVRHHVQKIHTDQTGDVRKNCIVQFGVQLRPQGPRPS